MALVQCPECASQVSGHATACPKCGFPLATPQASPDPSKTGGVSAEPSVLDRTRAKGSVQEKPQTLIIGSVILLFGLFAAIASIIGLRSGYEAIPEIKAERSKSATDLFQSGLEAQRKNLELQRKQRVVGGIADAKKVLAGRAPCSQTATPGALFSLSQAREGEPEWAEASALLAKLEPCRKQIQKNARQAAAPLQERVAAATRAMSSAKEICNIFEDGDMLVVEMHSYVEDRNQLLEFARAIADSDAVLKGRSRTIFFYDPARKKIAKADTTNGVRLEDK